MRVPEFTAAVALDTTRDALRGSPFTSPVAASSDVAIQSVQPAFHFTCPPHDYHCYCMVNDGIWVCNPHGCHCIYI